MKALVVYESMFGNTEAIARAIASGLGDACEVTLADVATMPSAEGMDLLVAGGPTHAFGLSRPDTRRAAAQQAGYAAAPENGIREWLASAPRGFHRAAAFDTRIDKRFVPGSAARGIARRLRRLGTVLIADPESFRVVGTPGPLAVGELDRARQWGEQLGSRLTMTDTGRQPSGR